MDKSPLFIRPYHVKEEDKKLYRQGNEKIVLFMTIKRRIFGLFYSTDVNK